MKIMFTVQGEGRGHMTQAIAVYEMLRKRGHQVTAVLAGGNLQRTLPSFFEQAFEVKVQRMASPSFALKNNRGVSFFNSGWNMLRSVPDYRKSLGIIGKNIEEHSPDLIVNFLEPLMGVFNLLRNPAVPTLAVGHQFMMNYPGYVTTHRFPLQQVGTQIYFAIIAARSSKLAISFFRASDLPHRKLSVSPPILRRQLFGLSPEPGNRLLIYLAFHGFSNDIIQWHKEHPDIPIDCFYDKPDAPPEERITDNLTFHRLDGTKFLKFMAGCRAVVCTAGVESVSEAAYLRKPLLVVPVENHLEQFLNSIDAERSRLAIANTRFALSRVIDPNLKPAGEDFKVWVDEAEEIVIRAIERAALRSQPEPLKNTAPITALAE